MNEELSKEQWQAVAEKLAEYLSYGAELHYLKRLKNKEAWIKKAKKELGYE